MRVHIFVATVAIASWLLAPIAVRTADRFSVHATQLAESPSVPEVIAHRGSGRIETEWSAPTQFQ